ncbi:MAG TPA: hypothetical protein VH040_04190 [Usitatibacter sp.]|jgi:hypothetical protein|nr:hypothetical protein [Usitatibacter sp.]
MERIESLTDGQLRESTLELVARLREFQERSDRERSVVLDRTLPGWSDAARKEGFRQTTQSLQSHHGDVQDHFGAEFKPEAMALQRELMARLGISVRRDGEDLAALQYDAADYLEELARRLPP